MGEWIYRTSAEQDWISLFYFINLVFIVGLHFSEPNRFWDLLKSFSSTIYISKYNTDQNLRFRGFFNLFSGLLILSNLGLLLKLGIEEISKILSMLLSFIISYWNCLYSCNTFYRCSVYS